MSAWLDKGGLRQREKPIAFVVNLKDLLITPADMDVRVPSVLYRLLPSF
jgi:hypothetical protein